MGEGQRNKVMNLKYGGGAPESPLSMGSERPRYATGGELRKKTISRRRKEGRVGKKSARSAPDGPVARTRDLPCARRGSPAARQGDCLDMQAFACL